MQRKFFPFVRGGVAEGGRGGSEDQICGNILSIFNFSRGKIIFFTLSFVRKKGSVDGTYKSWEEQVVTSTSVKPSGGK